MTEIDYLKCKLEDTEKAFDKLHKRHIELLKQQGKLEKENEQLKQEIKQYWKCRDKWKQEAKELKEENEQLKQEVIIYKKAFQQQVQRCTL